MCGNQMCEALEYIRAHAAKALNDKFKSEVKTYDYPADHGKCDFSDLAIAQATAEIAMAEVDRLTLALEFIRDYATGGRSKT